MYATRRVFKTDEQTENLAARELRSVIRFPNVSNTKPADIRRRIREVCGENATSVIQWLEDGCDF